MKKSLILISLAMVAALALCLVGCGNGTSTSSASSSSQSKVDINTAAELDADAFFDMKRENEAKAKTEYDGKTFKVTGRISDISTDHISIDTKQVGGKWGNPFHVYLPTEEIAKLNKGDSITVAGVLEYGEAPNITKFRKAVIVQ